MDTVNPVAQRWYREATEDPEGFWARAADELPWFRKWDRVYERDYPTFRWFIGAKTNLGYNCVDRHVAQGRGGHAAIAYVNERGERRVLTYAQLLHEVRRVSAALRGMGIGKGDRITIYMPVVPEAIMLMLATVRIGAIHSVVFAGFGAGALGDAGSDPAYAEVGDPGLRDVPTHENPAYARAGGPEDNPYEPVGGLLDAAASLFGPETPREVAEALQPIYENLRDCAAAMNRSGNAGDIDYEDISMVCENLVQAMRPLVAAGQIDEGVFENIRVYENRLDPGFAEVGEPGQGAG